MYDLRIIGRFGDATYSPFSDPGYPFFGIRPVKLEMLAMPALARREAAMIELANERGTPLGSLNMREIASLMQSLEQEATERSRVVEAPVEGLLSFIIETQELQIATGHVAEMSIEMKRVESARFVASVVISKDAGARIQALVQGFIGRPELSLELAASYRACDNAASPATIYGQCKLGQYPAFWPAINIIKTPASLE